MVLSHASRSALHQLQPFQTQVLAKALATLGFHLSFLQFGLFGHFSEMQYSATKEKHAKLPKVL